MLKQSCVSSHLKAIDAGTNHKSIYKAEVNYDMTRYPPAPILDSSVDTKGHSWLPGWIRKYWDSPTVDGQRPPFAPGAGMVRRPDVVIVKDPSKPPTQDNIKKIVEIKFPPDTASSDQVAAYELIAGDQAKVDIIGPEDCDCHQSEPNPVKVPTDQLATLGAAAAAVLYMIITKRPPPRIPAF